MFVKLSTRRVATVKGLRIEIKFEKVARSLTHPDEPPIEDYDEHIYDEPPETQSIIPSTRLTFSLLTSDDRAFGPDLVIKGWLKGFEVSCEPGYDYGEDRGLGWSTHRAIRKLAYVQQHRLTASPKQIPYQRETYY